MRTGHTTIQNKKIDLHGIVDVFRGLANDNRFVNDLYSKIILNKSGSKEASFYIHNQGERLLVKNHITKQDFETNFPFYSYEQFSQDMERIGINLRYISDEESE